MRIARVFAIALLVLVVSGCATGFGGVPATVERTLHGAAPDYLHFSGTTSMGDSVDDVRMTLTDSAGREQSTEGLSPVRFVSSGSPDDTTYTLAVTVLSEAAAATSQCEVDWGGQKVTAEASGPGAAATCVVTLAGPEQ